MTVITQERTARKPHYCERCHELIQPGEPYVRHALTPRDSDMGNDRWQVISRHRDDNYLCLATSGSL